MAVWNAKETLDKRAKENDLKTIDKVSLGKLLNSTNTTKNELKQIRIWYLLGYNLKFLIFAKLKYNGEHQSFSKSSENNERWHFLIFCPCLVVRYCSTSICLNNIFVYSILKIDEHHNRQLFPHKVAHNDVSLQTTISIQKSLKITISLNIRWNCIQNRRKPANK